MTVDVVEIKSWMKRRKLSGDVDKSWQEYLSVLEESAAVTCEVSSHDYLLSSYEHLID